MEFIKRIFSILFIFFLVAGTTLPGTVCHAVEKVPKKDVPAGATKSLALPAEPDNADHLLFKINFLYRSDDMEGFRPLTTGSVMQSGDYFKIIFTPTVDTYVYIFQIDNANRVYRLFPMKSFGGMTINNFNPVEGGKTYYVPAKNKVFKLDAQTGKEKIYFLAFRELNPMLDEQPEGSRSFASGESQIKTMNEGKDRLNDILLNYAEDKGGIASLVSDPDETTEIYWQEQGQTFSVLQQRLDNFCDGCVYVLEFMHQ